MVNFSIKYQTISQKTNIPTGGTMSIIVKASNASEARQKFKSNHADNINVKYKIISVIKTP